MIPVLGGLGAALLWAAATIASSRSTRVIGSASAVAWVMLLGLTIALPGAILTGVPPDLDLATVGWLAIVGVGNVGGLVLVYAALRVGKVGIVAPITSTEGALTALIAIALGERIAAGAALTLAVIAVGIALAAVHRDEGPTEATAAGSGASGASGASRAADARRAVLLSIGAASVFALGLYAAGHVSAHLPPIWVVLPARLFGTVALALPLALTGRLRVTRRTAPLVVVAALGELLGSICFALGARWGIAITAVLSSQFAALAAIAAYLLFRERLLRIQVAGVAVIAVGVGALSYLQS
jgi:drug/metabolite transporter (DMT)-like permease